MFGLLRLILAWLVVGSHTDWYVSSREVQAAAALDLGAVAVTIFFILSGFVMTATVRRYYLAPHRYRYFLFDRACRILPQYLFWLVATLAWIHWCEPESNPIALRPVVENIVLLPLMFNVVDLGGWTTRIVYIGQTWSLSLEWYFYMLLPPLLWFPRLAQWAFAASVAIFALASFNLIPPVIYSYHLLPGVLFIFLLGSRAYDELVGGERPGTRLFRPYLLLAGLALAANAARTIHFHWTPEVLVGILAGLPLVVGLAHLKPTRWDDWFGNLSYGVFLCHYIALNLIARYHLAAGRWPVFLLTAVGASVLAAISFHAVEKPLIGLRRKWRAKSVTLPST